MKKKNIRTIQTLRWILTLVFEARPPPFFGNYYVVVHQLSLKTIFMILQLCSH